MARYEFGEDLTQIITSQGSGNSVLYAPGAVIPFYLARSTAGAPVTDFQLWNYSTNTWVAATSIAASSVGHLPLFRGPDGVTRLFRSLGANQWQQIRANDAATGGSAGVTSWAGRTGVVVPTKADVGLANVENLSPSDLVNSDPFNTAFSAFVETGEVASPTAPAANLIPKFTSGGDLRLVRDPVNVLDAATKQYVDASGGGGGGALPIHKRLANDFTVTNTVALTTVGGFTATLAANSTYIASGVISATDDGTTATASTSDAKFQVVPPSGATVHGGMFGPVTSMSASGNAQTRWQQIGGFNDDGTTNTDRAITFGLYGAGYIAPVMVDVEIVTGGTGGDLTWQFAQSSAGLVNTVLLKGSRLTIIKVA